MNISKFLKQNQTDISLQNVVLSMVEGVKQVSEKIKSCDIKVTTKKNFSGDKQMALDLVSNYIFIDVFSKNEQIYAIASEEEEEKRELNNNGNYIIAFDPLDGSSLINTNLSIGSIFGVYQSKNFLGQQGKNQICAAYAVYGPRTTFFLSFGKGVYGFNLEQDDFILFYDNEKIEKKSKLFSPGNLRAVNENAKYKKLVDIWMQEEKTLRYSGGMVPDINAIFCKNNGIFSYPAFSKYPNGKLRILYECAPFAFLVEAAGGLALDQQGNRILDLEIKELHQRSTIFVGSEDEVRRGVEVL